MRILLIQPFHPVNTKLFGLSAIRQLTLPFLAALTPPGHEVRIVDENVEPIPYDVSFDLAGITTNTATASQAYRIADRFRSRGVRVVIGGAHATFAQAESAAHADSLVLGEGEGAWPRLVEDATVGKLAPSYRADGAASLAGQPAPRYDLVDYRRYIRVVNVETARGCPYRCTFCSTRAFFGNSVRARPVGEVLEEIGALKRMPNWSFFFTDDNLAARHDRAAELFERLIPLKIRWCGQTSLDIASNPELLRLARASGCHMLLIGFESLTDDGLSFFGKPGVNRLADYRGAIRRIHEAGITIQGCFIFGADSDTEETFERGLAFVTETNIEIPHFFVLTPYPGSTLWERMEAEGRILTRNWSLYDGLHVVHRPIGMTPETLDELYGRLVRRLYRPRAITRRAVRSIPYLGPLNPFWMGTFLTSRTYQKIYAVRDLPPEAFARS